MPKIKQAETEGTADYDWDEKCARCGLTRTPQGHDPCIANLPGVVGACCGHGVAEAYLELENGTVLIGDFGICREPADFGSGPDRIVIDGWCEVRQYAKGERIGYAPGGKAWVSP
jgi:hypothetical protein